MQLRDAWTARAERERQVLAIGAGALALILAYLLVWEPLHALHQRRVANLADARTLAIRLQELRAAVQSSATPTPGSLDRSLLSVVDQSGKSSSIGKTPSRIQPEGDAAVRVWFEDVPFDGVVRWLSELRSRHGVRVSEAEIERESGSGLVKVRLTLVR